MCTGDIMKNIILTLGAMISFQAYADEAIYCTHVQENAQGQCELLYVYGDKYNNDLNGDGPFVQARNCDGSPANKGFFNLEEQDYKAELTINGKKQLINVIANGTAGHIVYEHRNLKYIKFSGSEPLFCAE